MIIKDTNIFLPEKCHAYLHFLGVMYSEFHLENWKLMTEFETISTTNCPITLSGGIMTSYVRGYVYLQWAKDLYCTW